MIGDGRGKLDTGSDHAELQSAVCEREREPERRVEGGGEIEISHATERERGRDGTDRQTTRSIWDLQLTQYTTSC